MIKKVSFISFSLFCLLFFAISPKHTQAAVGNAEVTIYANTNPVDEFSSAEVWEQEGDDPGIAVKLPGKTQFHILSGPSSFMPGWLATIDDSDTVTVTSPDGLKYIYPENPNYMLTVIKNASDANVVIFDYNDIDPSLIDKQIDGFDPNLYIEYDYNDTTGYLEKLTAFDDNHGDFREFTITYDEYGMAVALSNSCGSCGGSGVFQYEYDVNGLLKRVKNANDDIVYEYVYDSNDWLTDKYLGGVSGGNHIQKFIYTDDGDDGDYIVDIFDYNDANSYQVTREYRNSAGIVSKRIKYEDLNEDANNPGSESFVEHIVYYYDANNIVTKKVVIPPLADSGDPDPNSISGIRKEYTYDPNTGRMLTEKWFNVDDVNFTVSSDTYEYVMTPDGNDILNVRVLSFTDARGAVTQYSYDGNSVDPNLKTMPEISTGISGTQQLKYEYTYDNRNRVTLEKLLDYSNSVIVQTKYEYDNYGNMVKRYDDYGDGNEITEYEYNGFNGKVKTTLPSGVINGWSYNNNGKVEYEVVYDPCDMNDVYSQSKYYYDANGWVEKIAKADDPNIFDINNPSSWIWAEYKYDLRGNKIKVVEDANALGLETTYEYNNQGDVIKVTLPNGKWTKTYRDGRGLVTATKIGHGDTTEATTSFEYDANGNLKWQIMPDGIKTKYEYDDFDRLIKVTKGL